MPELPRTSISRCFVILLPAAIAGLLLLAPFTRETSLMRNTLLLAAGACAIALPTGTALAWLLVRTDIPRRHFALGLLGVLLFVPLYLQAAAWDAGFGQRGWLAAFEPFSEIALDGWTAAIWVHGLAAIPWVVLIVGLGFRQVEPELEEAALLESRLLGVVLHVTLRRAMPSISAAALWVLVTCAGDITVTDLYQVRTYAEEVYVTVPLMELSNADKLDNRDSSIRLPNGYLLIGLLSLAALATTAQLAPPAETTPVRPRRQFTLSSGRKIAVVLWIIAGGFLVLLPLGNLVYKAGLEVESQNGSWLRYWSLGKFVVTVGGAITRFQEEFLWSLLIAACTATLALVVGFTLAWFARRSWHQALPALGVASVCLALPGPVVGLGIIALFSRGPLIQWSWLYDHTILAPVLAQWVAALPLAILVSWHALRTISSEVLESAELEGAGSWARMRWIVWPQRGLALAAVWLIGFAISLADLSASVLVVPPGVATLPVRIFGLLHAGVDDQVAGICLNVLAGCALIATAIVWLLNGSARKNGAFRSTKV